MILDEAVTAREMRAIEMNAEYLGVSKLQLMENAGRTVAEAVKERFGPKTKVLIACGLGGNGGDGFVAARHLAGQGYPVSVILLGRPENIRSEEARVNWLSLTNMTESIKITEIYDSSEIQPLKAKVIVDALTGTGLRGALSSPYKQMVGAINDAEGFKIAVDTPSGLDSDSGEAKGDVVQADLTLTFHKPKTGLKDAESLGQLQVCPIGIPPEAETHTGPGDVYIAHRQRAPESHKGDFGRLLVIGGSETYSGAPALTALGAYATGVDLVYVAAPETVASVIAGFSPSLITVKLKGSRLAPRNIGAITSLLDRVDAVAVGPGLGVHDETVEAVEATIEAVEGHGLPMLLDADGLKAFSRGKRKLRTGAVLTPHGAEFKALTGKDVEGTYREKGKLAMKEASKLDATLLLKGNVDVVSDGEAVRFNRTGNPGMTVGGTGDVLSGVVAAYMAMGVSPFEAAAAGAFINGAAGDAVYAEKGYHMLPSDLVEKIPWVIEESIRGRMRRSA
jgi:hydroxyethylthiazole kinase-like uncharacterized protein yjeF